MAKQKEDKSTLDLFLDQLGKVSQRGRPRIHANQAAKQKAYRERKRVGQGAIT